MREDIREIILDAVGNLLERYGYKKMTVDDIAHEAGIGKGTVYLYFPSKEEVALSWIDRANVQLQRELRAIARSGGPPADRFRRILATRVMFRFDATQRFKQGLDDLLAAIRPGLLLRRDGYHDAEAEILAEVLKDGLKQGQFKCGNAYATACTALLTTNALLPYSLSPRQLGERKEIETKIKRICDLLLTGLCCKDHTSPIAGNEMTVSMEKETN
jgi:AcrR family transcriptional regulator